MRINILGKSAYGSGGFTSEGGILSGPLLLAGNPTNPLEASTKNYVDLAKNSISASNITTGILSINRLPSFNGDFTSTSGSNVFTLSESGVTAGTYTKVVVDTKGRVTFGSNLENSDIPNFDWNKITSGKPTTLAGYGITDGINPAGDNITGYLTLHSDPSTAYQLATKGYIDSLVGTGTNPLMPGDTIRRPSSVTPTGFLRCNGGQVSKTEYSALYNAIGDEYSLITVPGNGQPWLHQYYINKENGLISNWTTILDFPVNIRNASTIVTKNRIYLLGGANVDSNTSYNSIRSCEINSDGTLGTWTITDTLPIALHYTDVVVYKNKVYLLGGQNDTSEKSTIYKADINIDGTITGFTAISSLPQALYLGKAIIIKNKIYYFCSIGSGSYFSTNINTDGTLGAWTTHTDLPEFINSTVITVVKNKLYILGGSIGIDYANKIYVSNINLDGTLGQWSHVGNLPVNLNHHCVFSTNKYIFLIGGRTGVRSSSSVSDKVYYSKINLDGTLGTWSVLNNFPVGVYWSHVIGIKNKILILGGMTAASITNRVYSADIIGSLGDYSPYYDGTITPTDPDNFNLPDTTLTDINGIYTFIKT